MTILKAIQSLREKEGKTAYADFAGEVISLNLKFRDDVGIWVIHAENPSGQCVEVPSDTLSLTTALIVRLNLGRRK